MKVWASTANVANSPTVSRTESSRQYIRLVSEVQDNEWFDLVGQIIETKSDPQMSSIMVWDGTKAQLDFRGLSEDGRPQTVEGLSSLMRVVLDMPPLIQQRVLGLPTKTWIHLRNVKGHKHSAGYLYCAARMRSNFETLENTDARVQDLIKAYEEKERRWVAKANQCIAITGGDSTTRAPLAEPLTKNNSPPTVIVRSNNLPLSTIDEILDYSESTALFRCKARVRGVVPEKIEDITRPSDLKKDAPYVYLFLLQLEDSTGVLYTYVYDQEGALFFGLEAVNLEENRCTRDRISSKMDALLRYPQPTEFIIKAYHLDSKRPAVRCYQITSTIITAP